MKYIKPAILLIILSIGGMSFSKVYANSDTLSITITINDVTSVNELYVPTEYELFSPYPNPFNSNINFVVDIPEEAFVTVSILNLMGQEVAQIESGHKQIGRYAYTWQADTFASGIYFVKIKSDAFEKVQKISLIQ